MRQLTLQVPHPCKCIVTTKANPRDPSNENKLARDFTAQQPNQKWLVDIPDTQAGTLDLAGVLDVFSRKIVGWAMESHMRDALTQAALAMALRTRQPQPGLLHHSDRGSQYTSAEYQAVFQKFDIEVSLSRAHNCFDNAPWKASGVPSKLSASIAILSALVLRQKRHLRLPRSFLQSPENFERAHVTS
jgi:transposase InsO family protein